MATVIKVKKDITPPSFERNTGAAQLSKLWNVNALIDTLAGHVYVSDLAEMKTERDVPKGGIGNWCLVKEKADADSPIPHFRNIRGRLHKVNIKYRIDFCYSAYEALASDLERAPRLHTADAPALEAAPTAYPILRDLEAMLYEEDEPDFQHSLTRHAYDIARQVIEGAYTHYIGSAPTPTIAPDGDGGVRVEWQANRCVVRLIVPDSDNEESYVYSKGGGPSDIDEPATDLALARRLRTIFSE